MGQGAEYLRPMAYKVPHQMRFDMNTSYLIVANSIQFSFYLIQQIIRDKLFTQLQSDSKTSRECPMFTVL